MRRKLLFSLVVTLVVSFGSLFANLIAGNEPALGLDLQGGISVTQQPVATTTTRLRSIWPSRRIRERVDSLGVAEPEILRQGDAIVVNLPGVKNQQQAVDLVQVTGQVYLRGVQGASRPIPTSRRPRPPTPTRRRPRARPPVTAPRARTDVGTGTTDAGTTATTAAPGPARPVSATPTTDAAGTTDAPSPTETNAARRPPSAPATRRCPVRRRSGDTTVPSDTTVTSSTVPVSDPDHPAAPAA